MKRKWKTALLAMGLVGLMASGSFASTEGLTVKERFFGGRTGITPIERIMDKVDISKGEWMELRKAGKTPEEIAKEHNIDIEALKVEMKDEMLQEKFKLIDEKVTSGEMTEEEAADLKIKIQERMENCEGREMMGQGKMKGLRMMGNEKMGRMMKNRDNCKNMVNGL